ncbi:MAG TPA: hypothetical protein VGM37_18340 [Armatimonadota bacterium]|jgi:hypothetical protein
MIRSNPDCQASDLVESSRPRTPRFLRRIVYDLGYHGVAWTLGRLLHGYRPLPHAPGLRTPVATRSAALGLRPGDLVRVKPLEEIRSTLDSEGAHRGLVFQPEMAVFCDGVYRVRGRVRGIYLEESRLQQRIRDTVILEGVYCNGRRVQCDRSCFLFWREAWLDRVDAGSGG